MIPVVAAWPLTVRILVCDQPLALSERILWQGRRNADAPHPAARTDQDGTDIALIAPPITVASPCLFCNPSVVIMFDSTQAGPNAQAHRERPQRGLSGFAKPQRGRDAVERDVRRRSCPSG
jgi:hypothetical protein